MSRSNSPVLYLRLNLLSRSLLLWRGRDKVKKLGKNILVFLNGLVLPDEILSISHCKNTLGSIL